MVAATGLPSLRNLLFLHQALPAVPEHVPLSSLKPLLRALHLTYCPAHALFLASSDWCCRVAPLYRLQQVRTASGRWNFYRKIYNMCTCDWSRMHDWPAEQVGRLGRFGRLRWLGWLRWVGWVGGLGRLATQQAAR